MTDSNPRRSFVEAEVLANRFIKRIYEQCSRIRIAGSIRRRRPEVGDIEIVAEPGNYRQLRQLRFILEQMVVRGELRLDRKSCDGRRAPFGPKYYRLTYESFPLDLFLTTPPADFWVQYVVRTGSVHFSHWLAIRALETGFKLYEGHLIKKTFTDNGVPYNRRVLLDSEEDLFRILGIKWIEPQDREAGYVPQVKTPPSIDQLKLEAPVREEKPIPVSAVPSLAKWS